MKKIILSCLVAVSCFAVSAQTHEPGPITKTYYQTDTTANTDTSNTYLYAVGGNLATIAVDITLLTGTIGGKAWLYGRTGGNWELLDSSATFTTTAPFKTFKLVRANYTWYTDYKLQYRTTTTQTSYMTVTALRRPDED